MTLFFSLPLPVPSLTTQRTVARWQYLGPWHRRVTVTAFPLFTLFSQAVSRGSLACVLMHIVNITHSLDHAKGLGRACGWASSVEETEAHIPPRQPVRQGVP